MQLLMFNHETADHTRIPIWITAYGQEYVAPYMLPAWADLGAASAALCEFFDEDEGDGVTHNGVLYKVEVAEYVPAGLRAG